MHFGGIHLVFGLFFLLLSVFWVALTIYGVYLVAALLDRPVMKYRRYVVTQKWIAGTSSAPDEVLRLPLPWMNRSFFIKSLRITGIVFVLLYGWQRTKWMGDDNRHYAAKEYWVSGQPLSGFRHTLTIILHPDNPLTRHLTFLQQVIYDRGISCLPNRDGEIGVWKLQWFFRPFIEKFERTYGDNNKKKTSPRMIHFLDDVWNTIEILSTREIEDPSMIRIYYEKFPYAAGYYDLFDSHYMGVFAGSAKKLLKDPFYSKRLIVLVNYLDDLQGKWKETGFDKILWVSNPMALAVEMNVSMKIKQQLISYLAFSGSFSCDDPIITALFQQYRDLMSPDSKRNVAIRLSQINKRQAVKFYEDSLYMYRGQLALHVMKEICCNDLPKESFFLIDFTFGFLGPDVSSYAEEIRLITTLVNGK